MARLYVVQLMEIFLAHFLAPSTWALRPVEERKRDGPQWAKERCKVENNIWVRMSLLERIGG